MNRDTTKIRRDPELAFTQGYELGKAEVYCEQVKAGAKLVGSFLIHKENLPLVRREIKRQELRAAINEEHSPGFAWVDVYRYAFVKELLIELERRGAPQSALDHWANGKLFGYSDLEICRFLKEHGDIDDSAM